MDQTLFEDVDRYINRLLTPEDEALVAATRAIEESEIPQISVSASQGKLLHVLALLCNASNILELGTLGGYSTIWLARALPTGGRMTSIEIDPTHAVVAQENLSRAGVAERVEIVVGKALEVLPKLEVDGAGPYDMIFIDADKQPYVEYFKWALRLGRPGTLIVADNVIRGGQILDLAAADDSVTGVHRLNEWVATCTDVTATILQTVGLKGHDGMVLAVVNRE